MYKIKAGGSEIISYSPAFFYKLMTFYDLDQILSYFLLHLFQILRIIKLFQIIILSSLFHYN